MSDTRGRQLAKIEGMQEYLRAESELVPSVIVLQFQELDALAQEFLLLSLKHVKERFRLPVAWVSANNRDLWAMDPHDILPQLSATNAERLRTAFSGSIQIRNGAAWLDAEQELSIPGLVYQRLSARLADDPALLFFLSVAAPSLETLLRFMDIRQGSPLLRRKEFRVYEPGQETRYDARQANAAWFKETQLMYRELGIDAEGLLQQMQPVSRFFRLPREQRHRLLERFLEQIELGVSNGQTIALLRGQRVQAAIRGFYQLSGKQRKPVPRRRFLKKAHEWLLSAFFQGSWLQFLDYLDEVPAEDDYVSTAIPKPRVLDPLKVPEAMKALPTGERERILNSLDPGNSGLRARARLARDFWKVLIHEHRRQKPGMVSLWGLIEDYPFEAPSGLQNAYNDGTYNPQLYLQRLPRELLRQIEEFYGRETARDYPTARTSALSPYYTFCEHLNPALHFWHGVGLTLWFLTQGPASRTDFPGMPEYYREDVAMLAELECPVNPALFKELGKIRVASRSSNMYTIEVRLTSSGVSTSSGPTRDDKQDRAAARSFVQLQEVYLHHLEAWTAKYFERFWRNCYRQRVAECGRRYNRLREKKGIAPTPKQFATQDVVSTINQYFGGDYTRLLEALGEPVPKAVSIREGNLIVSLSALEEALREMARRQMTEDDAKLQNVLVSLGIRYCILWEGRGKPPTRSAFGSSYYYQEICQRFGKDASKNPAAAWDAFSFLIERTVRPVLNMDEES